MPQKMRVSNQREYNEFLKKRGNVFHFVNQAIENWYENSPKVAGGNNTYSDKVVILIHIIVHLFRIGLRQAVGFVKGYMVQIGKKLKIISYTQASRRFKKLNLKIDDHRSNKDDLENVEIAVDSTRVSIYNNNGGHSKLNIRKRKYSGYGQVRKLHVIFLELKFLVKKLITIINAKLENTFVIYQGHHGDKGAHVADVILPGAAYTEKYATYVNTEGRVQRTNLAVFPPGEAKEDWLIIKNLSQYLDLSLPYDSLFDVRKKLDTIGPQFRNADQVVKNTWVPISNGKINLSNTPFTLKECNFYMTDSISRASKIMADCTKAFYEHAN